VAGFICTACGTQFPPSQSQPDACPICLDDRQFVPEGGQKWTTMEALRGTHMNAFRQIEKNLFAFASVPQFAIGQRAFLLRTPDGNVLWDCISLLDDATVEIVRGLGGISAIAISHPHYYTSMVEWSGAFGNAPIYLHQDDSKWIVRPSESIRLWSAERQTLAEGVTLVRCGGHFAGGTVLHWAAGAQGMGALLPGDVVMVVPDKRYVGFFRSFPNIVPLSAPAVERVGDSLAEFQFERIYGPFFDRNVMSGGKQALERSIERYIRIVTGDGRAERE
jgi:glyoxylase-like metal-dependent hydrolase (beta-lactamase superfamily II)